LDHCKDVPGVKYMHGCPDTDAPEEPKTTDDTQKLLNGEAVKVPAELGNYVVKNKWLRLKNKRYEYSDYEKTGYIKVAKNEMVEKLNAFYGLQVPLPEQNPKPPKGPVGPKPPKGKGLTPAEEAELNGLIVIEKNGGLLTIPEQRRKKELEMKKVKQ